METTIITIDIYKNSRGKKVARRNGRRITLILAKKLIENIVPSVKAGDYFDTITYKL